MSHNADVVRKTLDLLRRWGWEAGGRRLGELRPAGDEDRRDHDFFCGWLAAERGDYATAEPLFQSFFDVPALAGWARVGLAFIRLRQKALAASLETIEEARTGLAAGEPDPILAATLDHLHGSILFYRGDSREALPRLRAALIGFGPCHFGTGRVLDTLGMLYAGWNNFHAAREFFEQSLVCKQGHDEAGVAVTHGNLGRLYLDWGLWDRAEHHLQEDRRICVRIGDERGQAMMYNFLGQLAMARAFREEHRGRLADARKEYETAAGWLDASVHGCQAGGWGVLEGFARKDRALVAIACGQLDLAETHLRTAEGLFVVEGHPFREGQAHLNRARGVFHRARKQWAESTRALLLAKQHFEESQEVVEEARTRLEEARTLAAAGEPAPLVRQTLLDALQLAEACRRDHLVREAENELRALDPEAHLLHLFQRVRGRHGTPDTTSLFGAVRESVTVLFLDLKGSSEFARGRDPEEVLMTLNQMMSDLYAVLRHRQARSSFRGDGFMAIFRGSDHAIRGVTAALEMTGSLVDFNKPRELLALPLFGVRIGVATGEVVLGNVGTYDKIDFEAIGTTCNLGARLEGRAEPGVPCISAGTHEAVGDRFEYKPGSPRTEFLKGIGDQQVWDVVGFKRA